MSHKWCVEGVARQRDCVYLLSWTPNRSHCPPLAGSLDWAVSRRSSWGPEAIVFDAGVVLVTVLSIIDASMRRHGEVLSPHPAAGVLWLKHALAILLIACPIAGLVDDARQGDAIRVGDKLVLLACFIALLVTISLLARRGLARSTYVTAAWALALIVGLPRLLHASSNAGTRQEYVMTWSVYAASVMCLCVELVSVEGAIGRVGRACVPVAGVFVLRMATGMCRALGLVAIAARLADTANVQSWQWSQVRECSKGGGWVVRLGRGGFLAGVALCFVECRNTRPS